MSDKKELASLYLGLPLTFMWAVVQNMLDTYYNTQVDKKIGKGARLKLVKPQYTNTKGDAFKKTQIMKDLSTDAKAKIKALYDSRPTYNSGDKNYKTEDQYINETVVPSLVRNDSFTDSISNLFSNSFLGQPDDDKKSDPVPDPVPVPSIIPETERKRLRLVEQTTRASAQREAARQELQMATALSSMIQQNRIANLRQELNQTNVDNMNYDMKTLALPPPRVLTATDQFIKKRLGDARYKHFMSIFDGEKEPPKEAVLMSLYKQYNNELKKETIVEQLDDAVARSDIAKKVNVTQGIDTVLSNQQRGFDESKQRDTEILQSIDNIIEKIKTDPELKKLESKIRNELSTKNPGQTDFEGAPILNKKNIDRLLKTIPSQYRDFLSPAIQGLVGDNLNLNQVVAGLVGLAVSIAPGGSLISSAVATTISAIFDSYDIDLDKILLSEENPEEKQREVKVQQPPPSQSIVLDPNANMDLLATSNYNYDRSIEDEMAELDAKGNNPLLLGFNNLLGMARTAHATAVSGLRKPTSREITTGATVGGMTSAVIGGLTSGSAMTAIGSISPGLLTGAVAGAIAPQLADQLSNLLEQKLISANVEITDNRRKQIHNIVRAVPPAIIGAYVGYNPNNNPPVGSGILSGAGVTESKLTVPQSVIDETQTELEQRGVKNKPWQPKAISPTTAILDVSRQELYADDLEFIAFNYIPPTSEGAQGTVNTNPLKYSQALADSIRYDGAGVYVPYLLWNEINDANEMSDKRITKLALGPVYLPDMVFMDQDNGTTFENEAEFQYVNGENTSIEFISPYSDFSDVKNFWQSNEDSILYTVNP